MCSVYCSCSRCLEIIMLRPDNLWLMYDSAETYDHRSNRVLGFAALREDACPICAFTPMEKDKSTPSTSLRTTIAVFLRHAEKRYNDALAKEARHTSKPITKTDESGSMLNRNAHNAMDQVVSLLLIFSLPC